jgi:cytochrome c oxidase cbb3-type subunit IV
MDLNDMRVIVMLAALALFVGIVAWAWSARRRQAFDDAARMPFLDDERADAARHGATK